MAASKGDQELVELQKALLSGPTADVPFGETDPVVRQTFADRRAAQREAYGQFVATQEIYDPDGTILAFAPDHPVPVEHVEKWDLERTGHVVRVATADEARAGRRTEKKPTALGQPDAAAAAPKSEK